MAYFYNTKKMKRGLAGKSYSTSEGVWVEGDRVIFGLITMPAGTGAHPHRHPNEQFLYILQGKIESTIGGHKQVSGPGDIHHIPANTLHGGQVVSREDLIFVTAKDGSWGIEGAPEGETLGGLITAKAKKSIAAKYKKVASGLKKKPAKKKTVKKKAVKKKAAKKKPAPRKKSAARGKK